MCRVTHRPSEVGIVSQLGLRLSEVAVHTFPREADHDRGCAARKCHDLPRVHVRNGEIQRGSILFFDEPSANLNPKNILKLVELLFALGRAGVQVFVATHSYVVLKQFQLLAREHDERTPLCVLSREDDGIGAEHVDLRDRIPENPIVSASVDLFERDLAQKLA